jgi:hypothetical protein
MQEMKTSLKPSIKPQKADAESSVSEQLARTDVPKFDIHTTYAQLLRLTETVSTRQEFLLSLLQYAVSVSHAHGGVYYLLDDSGVLKLGPRLLSRELMYQVPGAMENINALAKNCISKGYSISGAVDPAESIQAVMSPVSCGDQGSEVICLVINAEASQKSYWSLFIQLLAGYVNLWEQSLLNRQLLEETKFTAGLVEVISELNHTEDTEKAFINLTSQLKQFMQADRVALGLSRRNRSGLSLVQLSDGDDVNRRGEFTRLLELCFEESMDFGEPVIWSDDNDKTDRGLFGGHKRFSEFVEAKSMLSVPLVGTDHERTGVVTLWWRDGMPNSQIRNSMGAAAEPLANAIEARERFKGSAYHKLLFKRHRNRTKILMFLLMIAVTGAMFYPITHRITGDVLIEPIGQRIISTPFDAILDEVFVETGDLVVKGDKLAEFDGRELKWQLSSLEAEAASAKKTKDLKLAERDAQGAQVARLDMERIDLQGELLRHYIANLEVRSPISGIIISGDLEQRRGSLISKGQSIFEIAPLDEVEAEIRISALDFKHIGPDLPAEISLEALPGEIWPVTLERIQPRAMVLDSKSVFIGRESIDNADKRLRPGMRGTVSITGEKRHLGWILFHRAYDKVALWLRAKFGFKS